MIRRPPRSTQSRSSAASDVYKRQSGNGAHSSTSTTPRRPRTISTPASPMSSVSYTHLRAHETRHDLVCRLLLEKKKKKNQTDECKHLNEFLEKIENNIIEEL